MPIKNFRKNTLNIDLNKTNENNSLNSLHINMETSRLQNIKANDKFDSLVQSNKMITPRYQQNDRIFNFSQDKTSKSKNQQRLRSSGGIINPRKDL